jgi:hypothetical protein
MYFDLSHHLSQCVFVRIMSPTKTMLERFGLWCYDENYKRVQREVIIYGSAPFEFFWVACLISFYGRLFLHGKKNDAFFKMLNRKTRVFDTYIFCKKSSLERTTHTHKARGRLFTSFLDDNYRKQTWSILIVYDLVTFYRFRTVIIRVSTATIL